MYELDYTGNTVYFLYSILDYKQIQNIFQEIEIFVLYMYTHKYLYHNYNDFT